MSNKLPKLEPRQGSRVMVQLNDRSIIGEVVRISMTVAGRKVTVLSGSLLATVSEGDIYVIRQ